MARPADHGWDGDDGAFESFKRVAAACSLYLLVELLAITADKRNKPHLRWIEDEVLVTPNGIDPDVFRVDKTLDRNEVLARFPTKPYEEVPGLRVPTVIVTLVSVGIFALTVRRIGVELL